MHRNGFAIITPRLECYGIVNVVVSINSLGIEKLGAVL